MLKNVLLSTFLLLLSSSLLTHAAGSVYDQPARDTVEWTHFRGQSRNLLKVLEAVEARVQAIPAGISLSDPSVQPLLQELEQQRGTYLAALFTERRMLASWIFEANLKNRRLNPRALRPVSNGFDANRSRLLEVLRVELTRRTGRMATIQSPYVNQIEKERHVALEQHFWRSFRAGYLVPEFGSLSEGVSWLEEKYREMDAASIRCAQALTVDEEHGAQIPASPRASGSRDPHGDLN